MRRILASLAVLLALACSRETPQPPPLQPPKAVSPSPGGGRLVRRLDSRVETLNYLLHTTEDERQVLAMIYDPLVDLDANLAPIPGLAARWEIADGGKTYVFQIDPRAKFSDGQPVRAQDVVFTLFKAIDEDSEQFASRFEDLDRAQTKAVDDRTVRVVFKQPRAGQLLAMNIGIMPEHVYAKGDFRRNDAVVGSGPYVLTRRDRNGTILLTRRDDYWRLRPAIESITFRPIADDAVAWKSMERGDLDVSRVNNDTWARVKDEPDVKEKLEFFDVYQLGYNFVAWNLDDPLLSDVRVRRALAMAFNRPAVIDTLYHGQARAVSGPFTADQWANNEEIVPIEFNPAVATALLASAGWHDSDGDSVLDREGKKFELTVLVVAGSKPSRDHMQIFQDALAGIGVKLEIRPLDAAAFNDLLFKRDYQAAYLSWVLDPDPDPYQLFHSSQVAPAGMNVVGYQSSEADQLMDEARAELDQARRADLYHQLHDVLARDQPYLWTVQVAEKWAVSRRVHDVHVAKGVGLFHWYPGPLSWWIEPPARD